MRLGLFKSAEEKQQLNEARTGFDEFAREAAAGQPERVKALAIAFKADPKVSVLSEKERKQRGEEAFRAYAENVLADDHLTIDEEMAFQEVAEALGIEQEAFESRFRDVLQRLVVAKTNDGRLGVVEAPNLMTKKNEVVHLEVPASLMKEVAQREWRAGSSGVSFRIAKGVYYRTGSTRGRSVVVGTELVAEDSGVLSVSSKRAVYMGERKTLEVPYTKLLNIDVFSDGVRLHASNRQRAPLFKLEEGMGNVVAATLNTAAQRLND
jgi:hypothetical protein